MKIRNLEWWILGFLGAISFYLAYIGYAVMFADTGTERDTLDLIYHSIKLFGMDFVDGYASPLPWQLEVSRWLAPAVLIYTAFKALLHFIRRELKSVLIRYSHDHIIVSSLSQRSRYLIADLLNRGEKVVVIASIDDPQRLDSIEREGAVIIEGDLNRKNFLNNIAARNARSFIFIDNDDDKNISSAISVYKYLSSWGKNRGQILYTHVSDDMKLEELKGLRLFEEHSIGGKQSAGCEIRIFSENERASRVIFNKYSPDIFTPVKSPSDPQVKVAIIGSGNLAQSVIIRFARLGHYANLKKSCVTLFHDNSIMVSRLECNFKSIHNFVDLECIDEKLELFDSDRFEKINSKTPFSAVYILCEDDKISSDILNKLAKTEIEGKLNVILALQNPDGILNKWYSAKHIENINLYKFNVIEETFTHESMLSEELDQMARIVHEDYLSKLKKLDPVKTSHRPWEEITTDFKNQNREQADHLFIKARALTSPSGEMVSPELITPEMLELLAEVEHNRWWAHMALNGWLLAEKRDDHRKRHTDLKPYNQLTDEVKQYDRDAILNIPKLLEKHTLANTRTSTRRPEKYH